MKSKEALESLTKFLEARPELRFWQGLLAWVRTEYKDKDNVSVAATIKVDDIDTFYWS